MRPALYTLACLVLLGLFVVTAIASNVPPEWIAAGALLLVAVDIALARPSQREFQS